jgi:DNA replication and repair protein RecF
LKINKLQVRNFRNIKRIDCEPAPGLNIFIGDNAQGKTSLLEAIYVLSTGGSFRTGNDLHLVQHEAQGYFIGANYNMAERQMEAQLKYQRNEAKILMLNHKKILLNHKDRLRVVLFTPDDLYLIKGSPGKRRAFLDFILKQLSGDYLYDLDNYSEVLRKRNHLLKNDQMEGKTFQIVNDLFIETAVRLIIQRINFVNLLDELSREVYRDINQGPNELKARYALSFSIDSDKINKEVLQEALRQKMEEKKADERRRRKTLLGPHLDDINFYQDGRLARTYASQGQQRNIAISLKLAEIYAFKKIKDVYPVFLLDEVLSELDEGKRKLLIKKLAEAKFQTFLTAVNMEQIDKEGAPVYLVKAGALL